MIRHSSSFFLSLLFHSLLLILILFTWKNIQSVKKEEIEHKICMKLCSVVHEKPVVKTPVKPQPKPKPKKIVKPKPKLVVKKVEIIKEEPIVVPEIVEEIVEEEVHEEIVEQPVEIVQTVVQIETSQLSVQDNVQTQEAKQVQLEQDYLQEHIAKIVQLLQDNLYYPRRARKRGVVGEVMVRFKLATDATVHSVEVLSSQSDILSRAAIKTIEDLSGKFPKPKEELTLHVPINYALK